jgi:hypothetical protein
MTTTSRTYQPGEAQVPNCVPNLVSGVAAPQTPKYLVHFTGKGFTAPTEKNPKGIKVTGSGTITVEGIRPASAFDVPWKVIEQCKQVFMEQCQCVQYAGDKPTIPGKQLGETRFPTIKLGKQL